MNIIKPEFPMPYSLHDMRIYKFEVFNSDNIRFYFENGYIKIDSPCIQVDGNLVLEDLDFDSCYVHILSNFGNYGTFTGKKLSFLDFLDEFPVFQFEIIDELYGYNQACYFGFLQVPDNDDLLSVSMNFYFWGNVVYEVN